MTAPDFSTFIRTNAEPILDAWDKYATDIIFTRHLPVDARDHARGMLLAINTDMQEVQTEGQQQEKSEGLGPRNETDSQAELHGAERQHDGFSMPETVSEFRALRVTILRLWNDSSPTATQCDVGGMTRFNEAIDKELAE